MTPGCLVSRLLVPTGTWPATIIHLWQGSLLLGYEEAGFVTSVSALVDFFLGFHLIAGTCMVAAGLLAILAHAQRNEGPVRLALLIPQQGLLFVAMAGALIAILDSAFADGVVRSRPFIAADQGVYIIIGLCHAWAMMWVALNFSGFPRGIPWRE